MNYNRTKKALKANNVYNLLLVLAYLRKSSRTFLVSNYLLNKLLETRNKPYTNTLKLANINASEKNCKE